MSLVGSDRVAETKGYQRKDEWGGAGVAGVAGEGWEVENQHLCDVVLGISESAVGARVLRGAAANEETAAG